MRITLDTMRGDVADLLDEPPGAIGDHDDLTALGLDSMAIMTLAARWRGEGAEVRFGDLVERPRLAEWWALVARGPGTAADGTQSATGDDGRPPAPPEESAAFPLAPMQHAYWVGRADGQVLGGVGGHFYFEFDGPALDADRLDTALRALTSRHAMFRARFLPDGTQRITGTPTGLTGVHDLRSAGAEAAAAELDRLRARLSHQRLDAAAGPLLDVRLTLLPDGTSRLHLDVDMLVCDAMSFRIALADLARYYADPGRRPDPLGYSYPRYLADRAARPPAHLERDRAYWAGRLPTLPSGPELPLAGPPERLHRPRTGRRTLWLTPEQRARLTGRARTHGLSPAMVLAGCYAEVLATWSAQKRFLLNLPLFDREPVHPDVPALVGDFTNLLLLAVDATREESFADRARRLHAEFRAAAAHSACPGTDVLRDLARARPGAAVAPVVFTSALSMGELFGPEVRRVLGEPVWLSSQTPQVWMDLQAVEEDGGIRIIWEAVEDLFPAGLLDDMAGALTRLLDHLTGPDADWTAPLPDLLPPAQRAVRAAVNATGRPVPEHTLHDPFFALAREAPDRPALLWADGSLTRAELADRALRLAGLLRARGVTTGDTVLVSLPKGPGQIVAVLGVLAAGATYVPAGVDQPEHRRLRITRSCGAHLTVTADTLEEARSAAPLPAPVPVPPDHLAYVLYTSGSTGEPKGVEVPHRSAVNTVTALNERFGLGPGDRTLAVSALDFDLSVYDVFGPLAAGGAVVCVRQAERRDARAWLDLVRALHVTVVNCVPTLLEMLLEAAEGAGATAGIRVVLTGGDRVDPALAARARRVFPGVRFAGLGGTTETAIHSTVQEVTEAPAHWTCVPYGVPLPGQRCRVVDPRGRDCPDLVPGELWIGGASVARGYRGDPERTTDRFVVHDGLRWYRTGDLARCLPDGTLEFLGRADFQLKVRGHRIEPGEIEAALRDHPAVAAAAVVGVGEPVTRLAAAVVVREPATGDAGQGGPPRHPLAGPLRDHLAHRLPPAMVPDTVTVLDALPLNVNGKIDRAALRDLLARDERPAAAHEPPRGVVEGQVAEVWSELLGVTRVGRDDDFFALGGDSLLATRLLTRLRATGLHGADLGRLFTAPALRDFAAGLRLGRPTSLPPVVADPANRYEPFPATDIQRAYWLGRGADFTLGGVGSYWYWEFDGRDVDLKRLEDAWNRLVERHEMMRAVFDEDGNQHILEQVPPVAFDVTDAPPGQADEALRAQRAALDHRVFDVTRWPLFHIAATRYDGDRTRIAFGFDYIVLDALSIMTIFWELSRLYQDPACPLPSLDVSFRDYVLQASPGPEEVAADQAYWRGRLPELPPAPALPLAVAPEQAGPPRFTRREFFLPPDVRQALIGAARGAGLTPSAVLAAAFADVLSAWSAQPEVTVNLTLFDRREVHPDINNIVGDFTSLLLVGHRPQDGDGWADATRRFQQQVWEGLQHSSVSALWVLRELARRTGTAEPAMPVVFTSTLGVSDRLADLTMPFGRQVYGLSQTPQVWLDCQVVERDGGIAVNWDAVEELFPAGLLDTMLGAYERHLTTLARADWRRPVPVELPADQARVRAEVNATGAPLSGRLLHEPFFAQATAAPGRPALLWRDGRLDHGELAAQALRVAGALTAAGVRPGDSVAIVLPKGPDQVIAVLGTLAAGACYVPVGVDQPPARRSRILHRANTVAVLTDPTLTETTDPGLGTAPDPGSAPDAPLSAVSGLGATPAAAVSGLGATPSAGPGPGATPDTGSAPGAPLSAGSGLGATPSAASSGLGATPSAGPGPGATSDTGSAPDGTPSAGPGPGATPDTGSDPGAPLSAGSGLGATPADSPAKGATLSVGPDTGTSSSAGPGPGAAPDAGSHPGAAPDFRPGPGLPLSAGSDTALTKIAGPGPGATPDTGSGPSVPLSAGPGPGAPLSAGSDPGGTPAAGPGPDATPDTAPRTGAAPDVQGAVFRPGAGWPDGVVVLDVRDARAYADPMAAPVAVPDTGLAYTIFTSGSTGEPKGVDTTHRAALNTVEDIGERFRLGPDDRVLALSALDFDLSVHDIFGLLAAGGALVLVEERDRREPHRWLDLVRTHRVSVWNTVPALLDMLLTAAEGQDGDAPLEPLRLALVSGDWVGLDLPGRLADHAPDCRLVALGGATEAAIWSNAYPVTGLPPGWPSVPYGYPLRNQRFRVVDPAGRDRPDWVPGELWIGGEGVARGYRGDPERTARQFVTHDGLRWYRTGDLGRYRPGGVLEFLGRADQQVKIRGHRIELGEIEAALRDVPGVGRAVACVVGERPRHRIVAFAVPDGDPPQPAALRAALTERLPGYMLPERVRILDRLPLTGNGKVDRAALAALLDEEAAPADEAPRGERETAVAALFAELLGAERVGRTESFFALGGDSLTATRATERLWRACGVRLTLREFFSAPTVAALSRLIEQRRAESAQIPMEEGVL
ncbi:amino acid adenylation domain-containing protein [Streptomyces capoamus]|uniref:amino acid adenylation domain-containing protein n=1 Tax=Streptomyces capoamus TaxID=68183 RepID=UPI0033935F4B